MSSRNISVKKSAVRSAGSVAKGAKATVQPAKPIAKKALPVRVGKQNRKIEVLSSQLSYDGPLFRVFTDQIRENGQVSRRDVIRHNGSAVILAVDDTLNTKDPLMVLERQYRHAAKQYLLEVPAGKLEAGENSLKGAKRELLEETGFRAKKWRKLARYFASPGFLGEWMQVFLAEGLTAGPTRPDEDEQIEVQLVPVSEVLRMIEHGQIHDGKTLISVMLFDRLRRGAAKSAKGKK